MLSPKDANNHIWIEATPSMVKKVSYLVKPGDIFLVSHDKNDPLRRNQICFVVNNERSWIEMYWPGLSKRYKNIFPILQVIVRS